MRRFSGTRMIIIIMKVMVTENDVGNMWWVAWVSEIKSFQLYVAAATDTTFALYIDSHVVRYLQLSVPKCATCLA